MIGFGVCFVIVSSFPMDFDEVVFDPVVGGAAYCVFCWNKRRWQVVVNSKKKKLLAFKRGNWSTEKVATKMFVV